MRSERSGMGFKSVSLSVFAILLASSFFGFFSSSASSNTTGFQLINAQWGSATNGTSASPGDSNIPLTVTLDYSFPNTMTGVQGLLELPQGFSLFNGSASDYSAITQIMPTGTIFTLTFYSLYLAQNLKLGSYTFTLNLSWSAAGYSYLLNQTSSFSISIEGTPKLEFQSLTNTLTPGEVNNISLTIYNAGTGTASDISVSASSQAAGILNSIPQIQSLDPGTNATIALQVYLPEGTSGSVIPLLVSASYKDSYGNTRSASQTINFYGSTSNSANTSLSVSTLNDSVTSGEVSKVSFLVKNTGNYTMFAPTYSISATQPLVVAGNSTFSSLDTSIAPGGSQMFVAYLTASPGSTSGVYSANIEVSYSDQYGVTHVSSYSVAILLTGSVELVIQNEAISQSATTITVTGSILNEGSASAYYSQITGNLNGSGTSVSPDYVGEIDANSPVPFTVTIPYRAQNAGAVGNISLFIQYKNSLGQTMNSTSSSTTELKSISQIISGDSSTPPSTTNQNGIFGLTLLELVIIAVVALASIGAGTVAVVRRRQVQQKVVTSKGVS